MSFWMTGSLSSKAEVSYLCKLLLNSKFDLEVERFDECPRSGRRSDYKVGHLTCYGGSG